MDDKKIIAMFFSRDESALNACLENYGGYMRTVIHNILRNEEDTEECMNDALLAAWNTIPPANPESLKHYLSALARNCSFNIYSRKNTLKRQGNTEELIEEIASFTPSEDNPEEFLLAQDLKTIINSFLETLEKSTRVCFVLRYYYAWTNEEIAKKTGKNVHAVAALLSKTRGKLKTYLISQGISV